MFNTTKIEYGGPSEIEVTEKRAPTDESVRLLIEMERAAMNKIIASGKVEDNIINYKWYIMNDHASWEDYVRCVFTVNGKECDFEFRLPGKYEVSSGMEYAEYMRDKVLEKLTHIFLNDLWRVNERELIDTFKDRR